MRTSKISYQGRWRPKKTLQSFFWRLWPRLMFVLLCMQKIADRL